MFVDHGMRTVLVLRRIKQWRSSVTNVTSETSLAARAVRGAVTGITHSLPRPPSPGVCFHRVTVSPRRARAPFNAPPPLPDGPTVMAPFVSEHW